MIGVSFPRSTVLGPSDFQVQTVKDDGIQRLTLGMPPEGVGLGRNIGAAINTANHDVAVVGASEQICFVQGRFYVDTPFGYGDAPLPQKSWAHNQCIPPLTLPIPHPLTSNPDPDHASGGPSREGPRGRLMGAF